VSRLLYFGRSALWGFGQSPFVHAVAVGTLAVALLAGGFARFAAVAAERTLAAFASEVEVSVVLEEALSAEKTQALARRIAADAGVEVRLVSADEALSLLRKDLGAAGEVLARLPVNPMPAALSVRPLRSGVEPIRLAALADSWAGLPGVASVDYGKEWVANLLSLSKVARRMGLIILAVVLLTAVAGVAAALQLAIHARREEIEIQKLVGATDAFVAAPFVIEGLMQGLLGAVLAGAGLWAFEASVGTSLGAPLALAAGALDGLSLIDRATLCVLCVAGMALGLVGSVVAVFRYLRG
jgi:cell division transport system permease protein